MQSVQADKADKYLLKKHPERVPLDNIKWHPSNRGHSGIMPMHVHEIAEEIVTKGTSLRRYGSVKLVEVPETEQNQWLKQIKGKTNVNTSLPSMVRFSPTGPYYANLDHSHFCAAQSLIAEGGRRLYDREDGMRLELKEDDEEGIAIQKMGVRVTVYSKELWNDKAALLAIMREDNLNASIARGETELNCLGLVNDIVSECTQGRRVNEVMAKIEELGYGSFERKAWKCLVEFRLCLSTAQAKMLLDCLNQVVNGRVSALPQIFADINGLDPKRYPWIKGFFIFATYCADLLSEENGTHKAFSHKGPQAKVAKSISKESIKLLADEKELLEKVVTFFTDVTRHYGIGVPAGDGENEEWRMLANATLMKALGRLVWKIADQIFNHVKKKMQASVGAVKMNTGMKDTEKDKLIQHELKSKLAIIEERYAGHLVKAGFFAGGATKPEPLYERPPPKKCAPATNHNVAPEAIQEVRLLGNGEVDTTMSISDVCKVLGLTGDGVGQFVAIRDLDKLHEETVLEGEVSPIVTIIDFNPPEATIRLDGVNNSKEQTTLVTIAIDDLRPLYKSEKEEMEETLDPLHLGYSPQSIRVDPFDSIGRSTALLKSHMDWNAELLAHMNAEKEKQEVEVVYIKRKSGIRVLQCRVKKEI